jgi:ABC-type branched-subunit amino acid transport system substrate-binding protein
MRVANDVRHYGRLSLISMMVTVIAITVNHLYSLGASAFVLGAALLLIPAALLGRFTSTGSRLALIGYVAMNLWMIVGFGLVKGLWESTLRVFLSTFLSSISTSFPKPTFGPPAMEMSGIAIFIGSLFVLYYLHKLLTATFEVAPSNPGRSAFALAVLLAAIMTAYVLTTRDKWIAPPNGIVKIGVIVPTEGPYALLGTSFVAAVQMAVNDLSNTRYRYELVIRDSGPDPAKAVAVIRDVVRADNVQAIVGGVSLIGQVTKPYATAARIPHICVCTVMSIGDGAYSFTHIPSPQAEAVLWVEEAQRRGIRKVALLTQDYPSINNHVKALKVEAARAGMSITHAQTFAESVTDFRSRIAAVASSRPDVLYVEALNPALDRLGQQLSDANVRHVASVVSPSLSEKPELFEGSWYTDSNLRDHGFRERFEKRHPEARFATHMMPYAYDSVNMIVEAFERGENPAVYLRQLETYDGTAGRVTKQPRTGNFKSVPAVWTIRNGRPALIAR